MASLVKVNSAQEITQALALGTKVIGVNNRNLHDFKVDVDSTTGPSEMVRGDSDAGSSSGADEVVLCEVKECRWLLLLCSEREVVLPKAGYLMVDWSGVVVVVLVAVTSVAEAACRCRACLR